MKPISRLRTPGRFRARLRRVSLRRSLPASFAAVALLTMVVLGAILLPLLDGYYARSERLYLESGTDEATRDLSVIDWSAVAAGDVTAAEAAGVARYVLAEALSLQLRIQVLAPDGTLLVDSGPVEDIDPTGIVGDGGRGAHDDAGVELESADEETAHRSQSPGESGLLGTSRSEDDLRSHRATDVELTAGDQVVATLRLSEGPAYRETVLRTTLIAWLVAGIAAVLLAAFAGWVASRRLTRPLLAITAASNSMARGDLGVRAPVDRADEIGSLAESFNAMAATTEQTVSALRHFVADAAHEIGTPLTALQSDLELAQNQSDGQGRLRLIRRAMRQAERIGHLSSGLLHLSRLESATAPASVPMETVDLVPLVERSGDAVASRAEQAGVGLSVTLPGGELRVRGNVESLRTAFENLLDNALKFTPAGGSVVIGVKAEDRTAVVWVEDTGIGIPAEDVDGLFSRFHRGRNASAYPGSGLGLAIVRATMLVHGGTVSASSPPTGEPGSGSRFELRLPREM